MIQVSDFLSTIAASKNFARPNLYQVEIFPPEGLSVSSTTLKGISVNCKFTTFPGKVLDVQPFISGGYIARPTPFAASYSPISMAFNLSGDHKEKDFFEEWMNMVYNETTNTLNYYDEYVGTMVISQLNRQHRVVKSYQLFEAWPGVVNEVPVSNDAENAISELSVIMNFRNYKKLV